MNKYFLAGIKICQKTGVTAKDFEFLQYLVFHYPNGIMDGSGSKIKDKINRYCLPTALEHLNILVGARLVLPIKVRKEKKKYHINIELIKAIVNE
jgi:hypothetical protein